MSEARRSFNAYWLGRIGYERAHALQERVLEARIQGRIGDVILLEAGLSFLGLGIQPPTPSWGGMILESRAVMTSAPWTAIFPGMAIILTVLSANMVGEALRAALDPRTA